MAETGVAAMLLAAGRGERMRPLTDTLPKPLLPLGGKPLMQWSMEALVRGACDRIVINTAWLGEQIEAAYGASFTATQSLPIQYSHEGRDFGAGLETAGGVARALPLLCPTAQAAPGEGIFWVLASDVFAPDFVFSPLAVQNFARAGMLAHLWLVPNPEHKPLGDFGLSQRGLALREASVQYTYSGFGLYSSTLFAPPWCDIPAGNPAGAKAPLAALLRVAMDNALVSAELYHGAWTDVGTPERLEQLNQHLKRDLS